MEVPPSTRCDTCGSELLSFQGELSCPRCLLAPGMPDDPDATMMMDPLERRDGFDHGKTAATPSADSPDIANTATKGAGQFAPEIGELSQLFPDLEIIGFLGAGGMGAVYKARQPRLDRLVALKVLSCLAEHHDNFALRFEREAQLLAKLNHPNIVTLFDFGEVSRSTGEEGQPSLFYFLMEYVDGPDLNRLIHSGGLEPAQALDLISQICDALQFAHDEGVTHRDIKPANILVDQKGQVRIADFGLAKLIGSDREEAMMTGLTMTGTSMGTPHYMAPEQWESPEKVDHRADLYSLGVVFYEMLTGERPHGVFDPPSGKCGVDDRIDSVVLKAMEREPNLRYQQASEVKEDVTRVVSGPRKARRTRNSRRKIPAIAGATLAAVCLIGVFAFAPPAWRGDRDAEMIRAESRVNETVASDAGTTPEATPVPLAVPPKLAALRERGGRLRFWSDGEITTRPDLAPADGIDDLVELDGDPSSRDDFDYRWMARRASGGAASSFLDPPLKDFSRLGGATSLRSLDRRYAVFESGDRIRLRLNSLSESLSYPGQAIDAKYCTGEHLTMNQFGIILNRDGTLILEGMNDDTITVPELQAVRGVLEDLDDVVQIDAAWQTAAIRRAGGEVLAWNGNGEVILPEEPILDAVDVACGNYFWLALDADGKIRLWGDTSEDRTFYDPPSDLDTAYAIMARQHLCAAQMADGSWRAWVAEGSRTDHALLRHIESIGPAVDLLWETNEMSLLWIEPAESAPPSPVAGDRAGDRREFDIAPGVAVPFRWCPPGTFAMGSPENEVGRAENETQHQVTLTQGFWLAETEFTWEDWQTITGQTPKFAEYSSPGGPVVGVSWNEIAGPGGLLETLQGQAPEGWRFDLPTEAQWEYACRAGTTTRFFFGGNGRVDNFDQFANLADSGSPREQRMEHVDDGYGDMAAPVGSFQPNLWGLHDMIGNVNEFCRDWLGDYPATPLTDPVGPSAGTEKITRGGTFTSGWTGARSAGRNSIDPDFRGSPFSGFRLALVPDPQ